MRVVGNRGYMLLGVIVSILVLCIFTVPVTMSLVASVRQSQSAEKRFMALELAQGKLEEVTAMEYEDIGPMERESFPEPCGLFDFAVVVTVDEAYTGLKNIIVSVYYTEPGSGAEKTVTIRGTRAKR